MTTALTSAFHALLIGIDGYSEKPLPDGTYYPHLRGCVRDIDHVEQFLRDRLRLSDQSVTKLVSPHPTLPEAPFDLPTYKNIVKALTELTKRAEVGDQVYIHYSGHGGRTVTMVPELKGEAGLDESLVPCDIGEKDSNYLRDVEIAYLLKSMSDKGLIVTLVLDSCHSGGATRGEGGAVARGIASIDTRPPRESLVADTQALIGSLQHYGDSTQRGTVNGWGLPTPKNFVLVAACAANQLANEFAFNGKERNGALTYWLLDSLKQMPRRYTYRMLHNSLVGKVSTRFTNQTPQIEGSVNRLIFEKLEIAAPNAINVIQVDVVNNRVRLSTGTSQGVDEGTKLAVFQPDLREFTKETPTAIVEVRESNPTDSWAQVIGDASGEILEGSQAVVTGAPARLRGLVRIVKRRDGELNACLTELQTAFESLSSASGEENWIRLGVQDEVADFQVTVNDFTEYEIWDPAGAIVPNLRPPIACEQEGAATRLMERLVHLTKYNNLRRLRNDDLNSPLAGKITVEIGKKIEKNGPAGFEPFGSPLRPLSIGEEVSLRILNLSTKNLFVAVLDFQPDWGVSLLPFTDDAGYQKDYELIGPNDSVLIPLKAGLPDGYKEGVDTLKIFATESGTSLSWLTMPALDKPPTKLRGPSAGSDLEQLLAAFGAPSLTRQMFTVTLKKRTPWATEQIDVCIRRPSIAHVADPALSLLQSAFDEIISNGNGKAKTRSVNGRSEPVARPEVDDPTISEVSQYCVALYRGEISEDDLNAVESPALQSAQERGVVDTVKYCTRMAAGVAREWFNAKVWGDEDKYNQYKAALDVKFGNCDTKYKDAMVQYLQFLRHGGHVPYREHVGLNDFVIENHLPADARIGIIADWATGEPEARGVLRQVREKNPHAVVHLGDIYYSGTEFEIENYFLNPWEEILQPQTSRILSFALPGNHDLYAGGEPFYKLIDRLAVLNDIRDGDGTLMKPASYFCLRNDNWQIIGMDTALHDRLGGGPTYLEPSEAEWLFDKLRHADGRRTILLSHHQLFSANDQFAGKSYNEKLFDQLRPILPQVELWLWGHEHDLVIFEPYLGLKKGRCVGGSAFPVGNFEMPSVAANAEVKFNRDVELSKGHAFYQHCYTMIRLDGANATISYYEDGNGGRLLFEESL